ncbi:MAG: hypothetical protein LBD03_03210 [Methanobrevibacter sp.]|nr:hypothetical protein [Candidatus Methanovirga procula]
MKLSVRQIRKLKNAMRPVVSISGKKYCRDITIKAIQVKYLSMLMI